MKHEQHRLEEKIRKLPRHKLSEGEREEIHDTLMKSRMNRTPRKNKELRTSAMVGLASIAALMLFAVLGLNIFQDVFSNTAGEKKGPTQELGHSDAHNMVDKQIPDIAGQGEDDGIIDDIKDDNIPEKQPSIQDLSDQIIAALENRDMQTIAQYVHPEKGLLFSPYVFVTEDAVIFSKGDVDSMLDREDQFDWGRYDGKGTPIELTPSEYFDEFLDVTPYQDPDNIFINDIQKRGNTENNIMDVFPNSQVIEYYDEGSEEYACIDWSSINLVYEKDETGALQLVAIILDMWTI